MELELENITMQYDEFYALSDVHLKVSSGIIGILGPNGAGKSTLMKIAASLLQPSRGRLLWNGQDIQKQIKQYRSQIGFLPQDFGVYHNLNAMEFLEYVSAIKGLNPRKNKERIMSLLELLNLHKDAYKKLGGYSGGMKQRIGIAQAFINNPALLILDEPTVGLDPEERNRFRNMLAEYSENHVVLYSTHIINDLELIADKIVVIHKGTVKFVSTAEEMLKTAKGKVWEMWIEGEQLSEFKSSNLITRISRKSSGVQVRYISDSNYASAEPADPDLDDAYHYCINKG